MLTGATGFLGMEVLVRLLERSDHEIVVLVRARDREAAAERLRGVLAMLYDEPPATDGRICALPADISREDLAMSAGDRQLLLGRASSIIHCAASIAFDLPLPQALNTNAGGASRMLGLARELADRGRLRRMVHVSTAYVCGTHGGVFGERDLDVGQGFRNTYERSKADAERTLREACGELPLTIARPSIVVGDSRTGWTPSFNVVYWPLRAFARGLLGEIPADPSGVLDIVPVDYVADAILALHRARNADGAFHLVAGRRAVTNSELLELACAHLERPVPRFATAAPLPNIEEAAAYLPYFDVAARFDDRRARRLLETQGIACPALATYFSTLLDHAERARWGKLSPTRESSRPRSAAEARQGAA